MKKHVLPVLLSLTVLFAALLLPASADGSAPIAENLELSTYRGVSVGGRLSATDPDGDPVSF